MIEMSWIELGETIVYAGLGGFVLGYVLSVLLTH